MEHALFFGTKGSREDAHLAFSYCGISQTEPSHSYGPSLTHAWVIHIVLRGEGEVFAADGCYTLDAGDGFVVRPGSATRYQASPTNPWGYLWFALEGDLVPQYLDAMGLGEGQVTFGVGNTLPFAGIVTKAMTHASGSLSDELELNGLGNRFLATLATELRSLHRLPSMNPTSDIVKDAIAMIVHGWHPGITASWVASRINVDRSHLSRVFHREMGMTIKDYIERIRLSHARDLLGMTDMGVGEVAVECGYANAEALTRNFRESYGSAPSEFRKSGTDVINNLGFGIDFLDAVLGSAANDQS